ncbi:hypothetical protein ADM96_26310 [Burkholderia sp. ST111]|nr:hypothetical protein ADM96_26310 [Burkholderia sp. ST111]
MEQTVPLRLHPLIAVAAVAVILASVVAVVALIVVLPRTGEVSHPVLLAPAVLHQPSLTLDAAASAPALQQAPAIATTTERPKIAPSAVRHRWSEPRESHVQGAVQPHQITQPAVVPTTLDPDVGNVVSVTRIESSVPTTGAGAIGGALVGGLLGNQVGSGRGRTATTIVGALGGALAGNGIEGAVHRTTTYQVRVQMPNDTYRSFSFQNPPDIHAGESVRVRDGVLVAE